MKDLAGLITDQMDALLYGQTLRQGKSQMADQIRDEVDKEVLAKLRDHPRVRAWSLSCPTCRAQPGKPCMERRKGHHIKLTKRRGLHPLRIMKAEWVINNAGESN